MLNTVVSAASAVLSFFYKFVPFINSFTRWLKLKDFLFVSTFLATHGFRMFFLTIVAAFALAYFSTMILIYNMINDMFVMITQLSNTASTVSNGFSWECVFTVLNLLGVIDAFYASLPVLISAASAFFLRLLYLNMIKIYLTYISTTPFTR